MDALGAYLTKLRNQEMTRIAARAAEFRKITTLLQESTP
jgi:hypothetical protein